MHYQWRGLEWDNYDIENWMGWWESGRGGLRGTLVVMTGVDGCYIWGEEIYRECVWYDGEN